MTHLLAALQSASPPEADRLMRAACQTLLDWQVTQRESRAGTPDPLARLAGLQTFFQHFEATRPERRWSEAERAAWGQVLQRLLASASLAPALPQHPACQPQFWIMDDHGQPQLAPAAPTSDGFGHDLATLLRPAELGWDEALQIDWAVRYWQAARAAGLLDDELAADFGEAWRRLEWAGLEHHLELLGRGHPEQRRLLAYVAQVSARYVELAPIKRLIEALHPELFDMGFALR